MVEPMVCAFLKVSLSTSSLPSRLILIPIQTASCLQIDRVKGYLIAILLNEEDHWPVRHVWYLLSLFGYNYQGWISPCYSFQ